MSSNSKPSISFCTKYTIDTMRSSGQTPTLTELNQAIVSEAKYRRDWFAAASLFKDFDKIVWERLSRLLNNDSGKKKIQSNSGYESLKQIWEKTPTAIQPLTSTELKLIRCVYQIMVRYAPSLKEANYYYLHLLNNHLDTPICDEECINHCLNSLIYIISTSNIADYLEIGLELVEIALARGIGKDPTGILESVSKNILAYHGLKIRKDGSLSKDLVVDRKKRTDRKLSSKSSKRKNKRKKGVKRNQIGNNKSFDGSPKNTQKFELNEFNELMELNESENNNFSLRENESADDNSGDDHSLNSEEVSTFLSENITFDNFDGQEVKHENINESDEELYDIDNYIATPDEFTWFEQSEKLLEEDDEDEGTKKTNEIVKN